MPQKVRFGDELTVYVGKHSLFTQHTSGVQKSMCLNISCRGTSFLKALFEGDDKKVS